MNIMRDDSTVGRSAGFDYSGPAVPGVPLRSTPGFMLSPRFAGLEQTPCHLF